MQILILMLIFQISASGTHIIAKNVVNELHPAVLMLLRASIAALAYATWMLFNRTKVLKIERQDWKKILLLGLLNIPLNQFLFLVSIKLTSAPNVSLAYALTPAFVLILALTFFNEKSSFKKIIGIIIAFIGTIFILFEKGIDLNSDNFLGLTIVLAAVIFYALYTIIGRDFSIKYGPLYSMGITMIAGWILYLPIYFMTGVTLELTSISISNWLQVLYLGLITSGLGYGLWYIILTKTESSKASVYNNLQPVLTTMLAVYFFSQEITLTFLLGGFMVISGVFVTQRG